MTWQPWLFPNTTAEWLDWLKAPVVVIVIAIASVFLLRWLSRRIGRHVIGGAARSAARLKGESPEAAEKRSATAQSTITWIVTVSASFIAGIVALSALGVNMAPLIAGAGIVGIALGFGAQTLIRDILNFVFIMAEHQFDVGDQVEIAGVTGTVIEITPRRTILKAPDGTIHSVPNGAITVATNLTLALGQINMNVSVSSTEDLARVLKVLRAECAALAEEHPNALTAAPEVLRLDSIDESRAVFNIVGNVEPAKHWELADQLQIRLRQRLKAEDIEFAGTATAKAS